MKAKHHNPLIGQAALTLRPDCGRTWSGPAR